MLCLNEVLKNKSLGLELVVSGSLDPEISGAHSSEIHDPARWLEPGNIMLTTGMRFLDEAHTEAAFRELVASLRRAKVAALFFGVGVYFQSVPDALRRCCAEAGFPLVAVAPEIPFRHVENYINQNASVPDGYGIKRMMWLTNDLLDSVASDTPIKSLIARLGTACRGTAVLYEDSGAIVESTGDGPTNLIFAAINGGSSHFDRIAIGRWEVMYRSMVLRGRGYHLAIATRQGSMLDDLGDVLLETTQRMLGAIKGISHLDTSRQRHENAQLLTSLQDGIGVSRELRYWELLKPYGFKGFEPVRSVVASTLGDELLSRGRVDALIESAERMGVPLLFAENGKTPEVPPGFHALLPDSKASEQWLASGAKGLMIGLSEPLGSLAQVPEQFQDAELAASIARRCAVGDAGTHGSLVRMDEVDPASWFLARLKSPSDRKRLTRYVQPLRHEKELVETIQGYLAMDQDVARVAAWLYVHPNTVRYRIKKVGEILGGNLNDVGLIANLYLAYQDEILRIRRSGAGG
ncbi:PucR family transcriptional regulator [Paeniglutamicibacter sulfureus]|uniref:PucR family transcriptional regulator n=1 Tax=Paeniglutamicibacter sulfureus TaxID=43666 RepID=UPI0026662DFB|nr:PucR family transcriptional regulator [Paeniglutamicibacter sulfureus]MDO2935202.1 PucR family transcriptional regulator [Paeniglutamicibacter sulfureus]